MPRKKQSSTVQRPSADTTVGEPRIRQVRTRGGGQKSRALKLTHGNFSLASGGVSARCAIVEVVYNAASSDLVRRGVITKGCIVKLSTAPLLAAAASSDVQLQHGLACVSTKPGQTGRADGYLLEGDELAFYLKKIRG